MADNIIRVRGAKAHNLKNVNVGGPITLTPTASDLDGPVARVDFFVNGVQIGTATQPPYAIRAVVDNCRSALDVASDLLRSALRAV